jgi:hypothetical protein
MAEKTQPTETPTTTTPINHVALWSMITGLAGLTLWTIPLPWSLAAVILGHIGLSQVKGERGNNRGFAVAGLVTGYIGIGLVLLLIALVVFVVAAFGFDEVMQFILMMTYDSAPFDMPSDLPEGWSAP